MTAPRSDRPPWSPAQRLFPAVRPLVEAVLFHGVPGAPPPPADDASWVAAADVLISQGLAGLAIASARDAGIAVPAEIDAALRGALVWQLGTTLAVETRGSAAVATLTKAGIPTVITKGPGVARAYPAVNQRSFNDLDVLVRPRDFRPAVSLLQGLGLRPGPRLRGRSYFDRYCYEAINLGGDGRAAIDVHHHVPPWQWGRHLVFDDLHRSSAPAELGSGQVRLAHPVHNLLVCALHVIADRDGAGRTLRTWRDVVALSVASEPEQIAAEARRVRLDWWLRFVLAELPAYARPASVLSRLGTAGPTPTDQARLRLLLPPGVGSRHHVGQLLRLPAANAAAFAAGEIFPSPEIIRTKLGTGSTFSWWRASVAGLLQGDRGAASPSPADVLSP